jgi:hypothetical protein
MASIERLSELLKIDRGDEKLKEELWKESFREGKFEVLYDTLEYLGMDNDVRLLFYELVVNRYEHTFIKVGADDSLTEEGTIEDIKLIFREDTIWELEVGGLYYLLNNVNTKHLIVELFFYRLQKIKESYKHLIGTLVIDGSTEEVEITGVKDYFNMVHRDHRTITFFVSHMDNIITTCRRDFFESEEMEECIQKLFWLKEFAVVINVAFNLMSCDQIYDLSVNNKKGNGYFDYFVTQYEFNILALKCSLFMKTGHVKLDKMIAIRGVSEEGKLCRK